MLFKKRHYSVLKERVNYIFTLQSVEGETSADRKLIDADKMEISEEVMCFDIPLLLFFPVTKIVHLICVFLF